MDRGNREEEDLRWDPGLAVASAASPPALSYAHSHLHHLHHCAGSTGATQFSPSTATLTQRQQEQYAQTHAHGSDDHDDLPRAPLYASSLPLAPYSATDESYRIPHPHLGPPFDPYAVYAADNSQAVGSNAHLDAPGGSPDDFYRAAYRDVYTAKHNLVASPAHDSMASAASTNRQTPPARSTSISLGNGNGHANANANGNGNGTPAKPPPPGTRAATRTPHRSVSNPVDDRFTNNPSGAGNESTARLRSATGSAVPTTARASVKDMKKKFEHDGTPPSSAEPRRVVSRNNMTRDGKATGTATRAETNGRPAAVGNAHSYSSLRSTGNASPKSNASSATQRSKFMPEDQVSTNSQSFASRINRPKAASAPKPQAAKSLPSSSKQPSLPPASSGAPLLFGEIRQGDLDAETPGYGIQDEPLRTSSDATGQHLVSQHQRSQSDNLAEPGSPTDWYRGASSPQKHGAHGSNKTSPTKNHGRSQSEQAMSKLHPINTNPQLRKRREPSPSPPSTSSRLPVMTKKLGTPSDTASPASTRSNSPAGARRLPPGGRSSRQQSNPTTRARTPVTRSKTPTGSAAAVRRTPVQNSSGSRLAAVISPPPKLSPPLRSSRPRQPVSQATTASSRQKAIDREKSPHRPPIRPPARPGSRSDTPPARRRKLSLGGPVDFAQRRETIKLKYSKSIRETEARQVREAAAEKRRKELEAAAKAKARAQAQAQAQVAAAKAAAIARSEQSAAATEAEDEAGLHEDRNAGPKNDEEAAVEGATAATTARANPPVLTIDSPTLGLPGTFPNLGSPSLDGDEAPPSAISETSVVTEFDNEAQTEPAVPEQPAAPAAAPEQLVPVSYVPAPDPRPPQLSPVYEKATYRDPFEGITDDEDTIPIQISLEPSSRPASHHPPAWVMKHAEPPIPGAFTDDHDAVSVSECESQHYSEPQADTQHYFEPQVDTQHYFEPQADTQHYSEPPLDTQYDPEPEGQAGAGTQDPFEREAESQDYFEPHRDARPDSQARVELSVEPGSESQTEFKGEYEPQPYVAQPYHTTTVTIISRDGGFGSPTTAERETAETVQPLAEPQMDLLEDFYTGPRLKDNIASLRDSTFTASDVDTSDGPSGSGETQRTPDTSNSLNVPSMMTPANRSSQQSIWTDLSYSSRDSRRLDYLDPSDVEESRPQSVRDDDSSFRRRYFVDGTGHMEEATRVEEAAYHRATDMDVRGVHPRKYASGADRAAPIPRPNHTPPPPPETDSRPASGYYDDRRPSSSVTKDDQVSISFPVSRRDSDDYHHSSTPNSFDCETPAQTPLEGEVKSPDDADEKPGPVKKEKSRLRQRQLCIREIVDTEGVFVRDMNVVEEIYKGTAEACPKLDDQSIKLIFRNTNEIIAFHTTFLSELKDGVTSVYVPRGGRSPMLKEDTTLSDANTLHSVASTVASTVPSTAPSSTTAVSLSGTTATDGEADEVRDRQTIIGPAFIKNIEQMRAAHEGFLRTSDVASKRLIEIQQDPTVQVWLNECNEVARDLTAAWNLDSLLIKPMQRITKYPNLIAQLLQYTPDDHPDREGLMAARVAVEEAILEINKTKKNFELVGQIVGRKRKESDVKAGFARAFGKRVDKLQASSNRPPEDPEYFKLNEKFSDDYLRLQVVLRDVEFYTRQVAAYVQTFLDYLSAMELVMRLQPGPHPELEAKWVQFNVSMRDIKTVALDQHLTAIRKHVIEPFELVIRSYQNPLLAMKKRNKRRLDYERSVQLKKGGKKMDKQLTELVEHYEALNDTLKKELPQLSALTEKVGNICLGNMINIQAKWWFIWKEKTKALAAATDVPDISEIVTTFQRDFREMEEQVMSLGILNNTMKSRASQSTTDDSMSMSRMKSRPSDLGTPRLRGLSITSDQAPALPTPDFAKAHNPPYPTSPPGPPSNGAANSSSYFYRDYYSGLSSRGPASPASSDFSNPPRFNPPSSARPNTGRSFDSVGIMPRPSTDSLPTNHLRRASNTATSPALSAGDGRRNSGLFQSALPLAETPEEAPRGRSSRASSRERHITKGYNVLWLAASLFEFNIETTKHEAGYPYLTYAAGEIFDVIAEKGELWLAKNQDDPNDLVGWIWSKHFAKLADS